MIHYNHIEIFLKEVCDIKLEPNRFLFIFKNKRIRLERLFEIFIFKYINLIIMEKKYPPYTSYDYNYVNLITYWHHVAKLHILNVKWWTLIFHIIF
jgi:hypothetical protein